ncbi:MAG: RagB/SusD family nutrient uptake outer membrane protein [Dysgonamonadaceae bacterium]|jgi:hypothetical protein|nr:RagB/SusD family nutrient uptake outer membrane protein [Dysgonamonadaceae bacterium]
MKKIRLIIALLVILSAPACNSYLDVQLLDQMTLEEVFSKRTTTEAYLAHIYSYLPNERDFLNDGHGSSVPRSDEALFSWYQWVDYLPFRTGNWGPTTAAYNIWHSKYTGISQATIFMNNVDRCLEIDQNTRNMMKAEARFLRANFYFELFRKYGPVFIWGDETPDPLIKADEVDRHTVDENIEFIISEIDRALSYLPLQVSDTRSWAGRITRGAAMAAKSRILLYAASPLFNGTELYRGQMRNRDGNYLFPQTPDPQKWERAAQAALDVINLNLYQLYEDRSASDPFLRSIRSYQGVLFNEWNSEAIWGSWSRNVGTGFGGTPPGDFGFFFNSRVQPPQFMPNAYGGFAPSLELVDTYPMAASGRYPVTGYHSDGNPIIDPLSGFSNVGFTDDFLHPLSNWQTIKAHNSTVGRDARFYASIHANGFLWINDYGRKDPVTYFTGGTSPFSQGDAVRVGFLWVRMTNPQLNTINANWGRIFSPFYRLAEIYLNYAEACNEKPSRNEAEALKYINRVRERAGLNRLEVAYPEVIGNQSLLRELIRKERKVELAFEGHRFYDARRWMIAEEAFTGPNFTLELRATNYEASWQRSANVWAGDDRVFQPRHYLFPINQRQLNEMKNITQNFGW